MTTEACRDWRGALGAAALGRIDATEDIGLRAHLDGCASCRAELRELATVSRALAAVPMSDAMRAPVDPSGALVGQVLERLAHERHAIRVRRRRRAAIGAGAVAMAAAAVIAVVLAVGSGGDGPAGTRVVLAGSHGAWADATLHGEPAGTEVDVRVAGLRPNSYYWLWVTGDDGRRVGAGTFRGSRHAADLRLTAALPLSEARRIWVTDGRDRVVLDALVPVST